MLRVSILLVPVRRHHSARFPPDPQPVEIDQYRCVEQVLGRHRDRPARLVAAKEPDANSGRPGDPHGVQEPSPESQQGKEDPALAYAPATSGEAASAPEDVKPSRRAAAKAELVPARLDRSNFNTLTTATPAAHASARTVLGAPITGVRSAARAADPNTLLPPARPAHLVGFSGPETPPSNKFSSSDTRSRSGAAKSEPPAKK